MRPAGLVFETPDINCDNLMTIGGGVLDCAKKACRFFLRLVNILEAIERLYRSKTNVLQRFPKLMPKNFHCAANTVIISKILMMVSGTKGRPVSLSFSTSKHPFPEISGSALTITSFNNWDDLIGEKRRGQAKSERNGSLTSTNLKYLKI
jgi:hypothetical protein